MKRENIWPGIWFLNSSNSFEVFKNYGQKVCIVWEDFLFAEKNQPIYNFSSWHLNTSAMYSIDSVLFLSS